MEKVLQRFLNYVSIDTTSDENSQTYPSTQNQLKLGQQLVKELIELGLTDAAQDEYGYITATIPANAESSVILGFISHLDTSPATSGANINAKVIEYNGGDIILSEENGEKICISDYPFISDCIGKHLVVTDGTTLLGADDKAGVAEIMTFAERLMAKDAPSHGTIKIGFTPDEEISAGTKYFDVKKFGANVAYTVDGGPLGELQYENFNAATVDVQINGRSIHTGSAKNKMVNATIVACEFQSMLPQDEQPCHTEGYEGFYHVKSINSSIEHATMKIFLREHDTQKFDIQKKTINEIVDKLNSRWGKNTVKATITDKFHNMQQIVKDHMYLVENAKSAFENCGVTPIIQPIRGGTDGARLSFKELPCPNLSTGGYNFHSRYEFVPVESLETMVDVLVNIASKFTNM